MKSNIEKLIDYLVKLRDDGYDIRKVELKLYHEKLNEIKNLTIS